MDKTHTNVFLKLSIKIPFAVRQYIIKAERKRHSNTGNERNITARKFNGTERSVIEMHDA